MPQHLPGFYYDKEKNHYFPIKGPIPSASRSSSVATAQEPTPKSTRNAGYATTEQEEVYLCPQIPFVSE
nr:hypothetical protein CFP56_06159 [Quercus suber]